MEWYEQNLLDATLPTQQATDAAFKAHKAIISVEGGPYDELWRKKLEVKLLDAAEKFSAIHEELWKLHWTYHGKP